MASKTWYQVTTHFIYNGVEGTKTVVVGKDWIETAKAFNRVMIKEVRPTVTITYDIVTAGTKTRGETGEFVPYPEPAR